MPTKDKLPLIRAHSTHIKQFLLFISGQEVRFCLDIKRHVQRDMPPSASKQPSTAGALFCVITVHPRVAERPRGRGRRPTRGRNYGAQALARPQARLPSLPRPLFLSSFPHSKNSHMQLSYMHLRK